VLFYTFRNDVNDFKGGEQMNQVYLSGIVADPPIRVGIAEDGIAHAVFQLCVSHKTSKGEWRRELYTINSWNAAAQWVLQNLKQGQKVALLGYLTQRMQKTGDGVFVSVEVTSAEFLPMETKMRGRVDETSYITNPVLGSIAARASAYVEQPESFAGLQSGRM
jgi:single-stranded DNA-binding protein